VKCGLRGGKGVKGEKAKGWGSFYQTGDQSGWGFVTTYKKLALQVSKGFLINFARGSIKLHVHRMDVKELKQLVHNIVTLA
jgi:hypothetical protein